MNEDEQGTDEVEWSPEKDLIAAAVGRATVNRWSFSVEYEDDGSTTLTVNIPARDKEPG